MVTIADLIDVLNMYPPTTRLVLSDRDGYASGGKFLVLPDLFYSAEQSDEEDQLSRSDRPEEQP